MARYDADLKYEVVCPSPHCPNPDKVVRSGIHGGFQRYRCKSCGKKFMAEGKAIRRQYPADDIADAIDMYYSGMSYKQVAENLEKKNKYGVEPSKETVYNWVKGYTAMALRYLNGAVGDDGTSETATNRPIKAEVGDHWVADEMMLRVGGEDYWCWNVMDLKTRYVLAVRLSGSRDTLDAIALFQKARLAADKAPAKITTDGLGSYVDAIRAVFPRTEHIVSEGLYSPINNNISERLQGSFRQRTKTQRGLETRRTGQMYLEGWVIDYNFFKKHHTLKGKTPAEAAGLIKRVPWKSWKDITRLGGEVAERHVKSNVTRKKKPGPKPKEGGKQSIQEAAQEYMDKQAEDWAKAERKGKKSPAVAGYRPPRKKQGGGGEKKNNGRGQNGTRL